MANTGTKYGSREHRCEMEAYMAVRPPSIANHVREDMCVLGIRHFVAVIPGWFAPTERASGKTLIVPAP